MFQTDALLFNLFICGKPAKISAFTLLLSQKDVLYSYKQLYLLNSHQKIRFY